MQETSHTFDFKNAKTLVGERNSKAQSFCEAIHIKRVLATSYSETDTQCRRAVYDPLFIGFPNDKWIAPPVAYHLLGCFVLNCI